MKLSGFLYNANDHCIAKKRHNYLSEDDLPPDQLQHLTLNGGDASDQIRLVSPAFIWLLSAGRQKVLRSMYLPLSAYLINHSQRFLIRLFKVSNLFRCQSIGHAISLVRKSNYIPNLLNSQPRIMQF